MLTCIRNGWNTTDFTAATSEGELPTFFAARAGNTEALQLLQTAGCDLGKRSHNGDLALVAAARAGQKNAVEWLLQAGSGSKIKKLDMQRAFHVACKLTQPGHRDLVSLLEEQVGASSQSHKLSRNLLKEKAGRGTGKYYHEMQLLTRFEWIQAGWATSAFEGDRDLGRHREGWCWEGWLSGIMEKSHAGKAEQVQMRPWEPGDVLGFALDYNGGKMHLSHQGTWYPEKADYFMDFEPNGRDLCLVNSGQFARCNFASLKMLGGDLGCGIRKCFLQASDGEGKRENR
ncbi:kidins220 [Symbiodinium natans]|uniref:Kidins220 protein n=1 Tax=Symbiodinium natans TaxID=878477 RepID=A0A812I225_9DINO|nr:kidins220 [Symbiodinium natans]